MNDSSLGQLILNAGGGSRAPSRDVNFGAKGALFLASSKGLLDPPSLSLHEKYEQ
jgi:hypothetical protein